MKFGSVREYFYKLNTVGYQLMMIPLILFTVYYAQWFFKLPEWIKFNKDTSNMLFVVGGCLSVVAIALIQILAKMKANRIALQVGLGIKLEELGTMFKKKMVALSTLVLLNPLMLLFTDENYFSVTFSILSLWYFLQWPTPARVCRILKLKGDEKEMVITRGDAFK